MWGPQSKSQPGDLKINAESLPCGQIWGRNYKGVIWGRDTPRHTTYGVKKSVHSLWITPHSM